MKGTKIDVLDDPELARHKKNTQVQSNVQYHGEIERKQKQEAARPTEDPNAKPISELLTFFPIKITFYDELSV
jgi:hypothetical protein